MRYAIFSDVHNHTEALQAVLDDAEKQQVDQFFCLGDVGIDACVELVRQASAPTVFGNWEVAHWRHLSRQNQQWALRLPPMRRQASFWLTHAAPFWPQSTTSLADFQRAGGPMMRHFPYLHSESETLWQACATLAEANIPLMFHGHTHKQMIWRFAADNSLQKLLYREITLTPNDLFIVGVGSVGRPTDIPGAAYVIFDDATQTLTMRRLCPG